MCESVAMTTTSSGAVDVRARYAKAHALLAVGQLDQATTELVWLWQYMVDHEPSAVSTQGTNSSEGPTRNDVGAENIYLVRPDGSGVTKLTDGDVRCTAPNWGRDGWVYFASDALGNFDIWRLQPVDEFAAHVEVAAEPAPRAADAAEAPATAPQAAPPAPKVRPAKK